MSDFFDSYSDESTAGFNWVSREEKEVLIKNQVAFPVNSVLKVSSKFGPRYVVKTEIEGEDRAIGFAADSVPSRDAMLDAIENYLQEDGVASPVVFIERVDRSLVLRDARRLTNEE